MVFIQSPLVDLFEKQLIDNPNSKFDVGFALQKFNDFTDEYRHDLKWRLKIPKQHERRPQRNIVIEGFSTSKSGTGKSTVFVGEAWNMLRINYPDYDAVKFVNNFVHWSLAEFKVKVKLTKDMVACCHVFDETRKSEALGIGSSAFIMGVADLVSVCRLKGLSVIRIMPSEARHKSINPHYRIDVNKMDVDTNRNLSLLQDNDLRYRGHIITRKPDVKELWKAYEDKKEEFIEKMLSDEYDTRFSVYESMVRKLVSHSEFSKCKKKDDFVWLAMKVLGSEIPKNALNLIINRARRENQQ